MHCAGNLVAQQYLGPKWFGSVEESLPVAVTVFWNVVWMRPSAAICRTRPSAYVDFSFVSVR